MRTAISFVFWRAAPFAVFALYDLALIHFHYTALFKSAENPILDFVGFWGALFAIPGLILLGGGHFARKFPPSTSFSIFALLASSLIAAANPFTVFCWTLSLTGGYCT